MDHSPLERVRAVCTKFPDTVENEAETNTFSVRGRNFVVYWHNWFSDPRPAVWCKAPPGAQEELIAADSARFFVPPWMGRHGWIGVRLDSPPDWDELAAICEQAYRMTATKAQITRLDGSA